jgi:3-deoxy-D-manno-octulosonate 8-phosphate phosphatase (KDO 8-P phosphatase)
MEHFIDRAKQIKLAIFDVDGVLTNGGLYYSKEGSAMKEFHVHDGIGIKLLLQAGLQVAIITGCHSRTVERRMQDLGVLHVYQGQNDKLPAYEELKNKTQLADENILYMGDDFPDLPLLTRVGLGITVANAPKIIQQYAAWVTHAKGGRGAVREVCDFLLEAQDLYKTLIKQYLV